MTNEYLKKNRKNKVNRRGIRIHTKWQQRFIICLAIISTICAVGLALKVIPYVSDIIAFRREQTALPELSPFDAAWLEINPDYVGWLKIDDTIVDFPVVRGNDNEKYLYTTFRGNENILGAIFMDYRCVGENMPHIIIYGHQVDNMDGNIFMFGGLNKFLDEQYMADHPIIMFMANSNLFEFEIYSARITDISDPAYQLDFNAPDSFKVFIERNGSPDDALQIITLSTCDGADNERRMIVQGALKRIVPIRAEYAEEDGWTIVKPK